MRVRNEAKGKGAGCIVCRCFATVRIGNDFPFRQHAGFSHHDITGRRVTQCDATTSVCDDDDT